MGLALRAVASPEGQNGLSGLAYASPVNPCNVIQLLIHSRKSVIHYLLYERYDLVYVLADTRQHVS